MRVVKQTNLVIRLMLEICALTAYAYWGFHITSILPLKILIGFGTPALAASLWSRFGAPHTKTRVQGAARILFETLIFGGSVLALWSADKHMLAEIFAAVLLINRFLITAWKQ